MVDKLNNNVKQQSMIALAPSNFYQMRQKKQKQPPNKLLQFYFG